MFVIAFMFVISLSVVWLLFMSTSRVAGTADPCITLGPNQVHNCPEWEDPATGKTKIEPCYGGVVFDNGSGSVVQVTPIKKIASNNTFMPAAHFRVIPWRALGRSLKGRDVGKAILYDYTGVDNGSYNASIRRGRDQRRVAERLWKLGPGKRPVPLLGGPASMACYYRDGNESIGKQIYDITFTLKRNGKPIKEIPWDGGGGDRFPCNLMFQDPRRSNKIKYINTKCITLNGNNPRDDRIAFLKTHRRHCLDVTPGEMQI